MQTKKWLASWTLAAAIALSVGQTEHADAKVIWDGAEVTAGQTGKLSFNKATKIYKKNADGTFTSMVAPKGAFYRVYGAQTSSVGLVYNMSGGYRVNATNLVTYKDIPVAVQKQVGLKATMKTQFSEKIGDDEANIQYVQLSGLANGQLERTINQYQQKQAAAEVYAYEEAKRDRDANAKENPNYNPPIYSYYTSELEYNSKGYVSISMNSETYFGGAHGNRSTNMVHYNVLTAKQVNLTEFAKTAAQRKKLNDFVRNKMQYENTHTADGMFWLNEYDGVPVTQPFYIKEDGIELIYNPYDLGPYASGTRYIYVPFKSFQ